MFDSWFTKIGVKQGIFWGVMIYLVGSLNDVMTRFAEARLEFTEVAFFRCFFSTIVVFIPMLFYKRHLFKTEFQKLHLLRGAIGTIGLVLCALGIFTMPIAENTTILFSEAFFILPLAAVFLNEKLSKKSWVATFIGFIGIIVMFRPTLENFNKWAIVPTIAALAFALLSVMLKKMVNKEENNFTIIFYFGIYSTIFSSLLLPFCWITPTLKELGLLLLLGCGGSLIQLCVYMAYRSASASALSPIRYTELLFSMLFGYLFFRETIDTTAIIGAIFIISGAIFASSNINDEAKDA